MAVLSEWSQLSTLAGGDWNMADDVALVAGEFRDLATRQVGAKRREFFGSSKIYNGVDDRGTLTADINTDSPADIAGTLRLVVRQTDGVTQQFIKDFYSTDFEAGVKVGKGGKTGNENQVFAAGEDSYLVVQYRPDSDATASKDDCTLQIPITIQSLG